jgi:hypothetical protein
MTAADSSSRSLMAASSSTRCARSTRPGPVAAQEFCEVLVLHGPHLGLRIPPGMPDLVEHSRRPTRRTPTRAAS